MVQDGASSTYLLPGTREVTLDLDKNQCAPLLFYPLSGNSADDLSLSFFAPAGCVYPASTTATWLDGFGARLCLDLLTQVTPGQTAEQRRAFCNRFNWQRFSSEVVAMDQAAAAESTESMELSSINTPYNPWNLNRQKIITAISTGKFTKTTLKGNAKDKPISVTVNITSGAASPIYYQPYVLASPVFPIGAPASLTVPYRAGVGDNVLFDPNAGAVLLVSPEGKNYRLAILPLGHYTQGL
jgi:hypothetical protein